MSNLFDQILSAPGLFHIGEFIFLDLIEDERTFASLELVSKVWANYFVLNQLWRKRLQKRTAKYGSYQAMILQLHERQFISLEEAHKHYRKRAFAFTSSAMKCAWSESKFKVTKITQWNIVRDLNQLDGSKIVFAQDNKVTIAQRSTIPLDEQTGINELPKDLVGHRREVTCLDVDQISKLAIAGGRDRHLSLWDLSQGSLVTIEKSAHSRLITCVKLRNSHAYSSSRDRSVKVWNVPQLQLLQVLQGYHGHSVWAIDVRNLFLVTASSDKSMNVWTNNEQLWSLKFELNNNNAPLRNILILNKRPALAVTGDLVGDIKVWNLNVGAIEFEVPDPRREFTFPGAVVSLSQSSSFFAAGYSTNDVALFDSNNYNSILTIDICRYVDKNSFIRSIYLCDGQLYVCNVSGKVGILIFSLWE